MADDRPWSPRRFRPQLPQSEHWENCSGAEAAAGQETALSHGEVT